MRFGLPLMVLTSLSLHLIAVAIWMLTGHSPHGSYSTSKTDTGPMVILTKESVPSNASTSSPSSRPSHASPQPAGIPVANAAKTPPPAPNKPVDIQSILAPSGAPHLDGGVVFVLDISGSMYERYAGRTRLVLARQLLDQQIASLPKGTPFAVTVYGESALRSGPLVEANELTRDAAVRYLAEDPDLGGGTNLPAGLDVAEQLHPDSIVVVTDGDLNIANDKLMSEARRILGKPGPNLSVIGIAPRTKTDDELLLRNLVRQQAGHYQAVAVPGADPNEGTPDDSSGPR